MGKLKLEHFVKTGIFLAPKSYTLLTECHGDIVKHKGPAKDKVNVEWFMGQYADTSLTEKITLQSFFKIDWHTLNIAKKEFQFQLGSKVATKREPVYDDKNVWVDTLPKNVIDFAGHESTIIKYELMLQQKLFEEKENIYYTYIDSLMSELAKKDDEIQSKDEEIQSLSAAKPSEVPVKHTLTEEVEPPTQDKKVNKPKGKKANAKKQPNSKKKKSKKKKSKKS